MGIRIKPVERTIINEKAVIKQVIEKTQRKPSKETIAKYLIMIFQYGK
jgi:hypothetical protein